MTNNKNFEMVINNLTTMRDVVGDRLMGYNYEGQGKSDKADFEKDMTMAIEALEKQIPKKVNTYSISKVKAIDCETQEIYTYKVVRCPSCDKPMTLYRERKYCDVCGQALDWSEE